MSGGTTIKTPRREGGPRGAYRLVVLHAPGKQQAGATVALGPKAVTIGRRESEPDVLALDDGEASRAHAVVEPAGEGHRIRDLGSSNGTFVMGRRVAEYVLTDGEVIRVGAHIVLYQFVSFEDARQVGAVRRTESKLVGVSFALDRVRAAIAVAAGKAAPVLILGESGTGKELVAHELHRLSGRSGQLVAVNCAALPKDLVEAELFGRARGAFTGAAEASRGLFGEAEGGTLVLDELGEMPLDVQPKLLRALATGEVRGVGETRARHADVRIIAATNVPLEAAVEQGAFRGDLWARVSGVRIEVPPLRTRREDVLPLVAHFWAATGASPVELTADAAEALVVHDWRFNAREIEQVVHALSDEVSRRARLDIQDLPARFSEPFSSRLEVTPIAEVPLALRVRRDGTPSAEELTEVLRHFEGSFARAADFFGKDRKQVYRWAERYGIDPESLRPAGDGDGDG